MNLWGSEEIHLPSSSTLNGKNEQLTWPTSTWFHQIWFGCACVCVCYSVLLERNGVSKGVVWRSSVCFVDNWDLELKHRSGRWCVGFCFRGCVCVCVLWTGIRPSALCVLVYPYSNSVSDWSQRSLRTPPLSSFRAWADPWSAMAWPQAHLLSWSQMCQRLASDLCLRLSVLGVRNLCQTFVLFFASWICLEARWIKSVFSAFFVIWAVVGVANMFFKL